MDSNTSDFETESKRKLSLIDYPEAYKEACFFAWYQNDRPKLKSINNTNLMKIIPPAPDGRKPSVATVRDWVDKYGWNERADALDAELARRLETEAIEKKAQKYREIATMGEELMKKGWEHVTTEPFDTSASAVRAIGLGAEMVAKFGSAADRMLMLGAMTPKQLDALAYKLLGRNENEDSINVEAEDVEEAEEMDGDADNTG